MPMSEYMRGLRAKVGNDLVLVPSVTGIVFDPGGRVLLARHSETGRWVAPGGAIDPGESPANAVVRELWEETGLAVEPVRVIGVYGGPGFEVRYQNGDRMAFVMTVFECRSATGGPRPDGVEILQVAYWAIPDLAGQAISPWLQMVLADLDPQRTETRFQRPTWHPPHDDILRGRGDLC